MEIHRLVPGALHNIYPLHFSGFWTTWRYIDWFPEHCIISTPCISVVSERHGSIDGFPEYGIIYSLHFCDFWTTRRSIDWFPEYGIIYSLHFSGFWTTWRSIDWFPEHGIISTSFISVVSERHGDLHIDWFPEHCIISTPAFQWFLNDTEIYRLVPGAPRELRRLVFNQKTVSVDLQSSKVSYWSASLITLQRIRTIIKQKYPRWRKNRSRRLYICPEACRRKGRGRAESNTSPLTTKLHYFPADPQIFRLKTK